MKKTVLLVSAIAIVCVTALVLVGCPKPTEIPMSIYRGSVYGVTPYYNDELLTYSDAYYFKANDTITIRYTLTAEAGEDYKTYTLSVGKLATEGGLFKIVDYVRDPNSIVNKHILSKNERFALIKSDN